MATTPLPTGGSGGVGSRRRRRARCRILPVALPDQPRTLAQLPADSISPNRLAIRSKLGRGKVVESRIGSPPRRICSEMV